MLKRKSHIQRDRVRFYNYKTGDYIGCDIFNTVPKTGEYIQFQDESVPVMQVIAYSNSGT